MNPAPPPRTPHPALLGVAGLALGVALAAVVGDVRSWESLQALPGYFNDDGANAIYLHHTTHTALLAGSPIPFDANQFVPFGYRPTGASGGNMAEMALSGLFRLFLPWPTWYTVAALAWIPLNLLAFLPLGRHLWPRAPGATLAAAGAWAVMPPLLGQIAAGRLTQVVLLGVPLAVLGLLRTAEQGGLRSQVLAGVGLAITGAGYWFYAFFLGLLLPLFAAWGAARRGLRAALVDLARAGLVGLTVASPLLVLVVWGRLSQGGTMASPISSSFASPDFTDALRLSGEHVRHVRGWMPPVLLVGTLITLWRGERRLLWLGCAGLCTIFALGPGQHLGEQLWLLPYYPLWRWVPMVDSMSHPERWLAVGGLFWVILAVDGLARGPWWSRSLAWLVPVGVVLTGFSSGQAPLDRWSLRVPGVWKNVAQQPTGSALPQQSDLAPGGRPGTVVALPLADSSLSCAYQPFVGRPLLGGMVENQHPLVPEGWVSLVNDNDLLRALYGLSAGTDLDVPVYQEDLDALRAIGVDTVLLDRNRWGRSQPRSTVPVERRLTAAFGEPSYEDRSGAWWALPTRGQPGSPPAATGPAIGDLGPPGPPPERRPGKGNRVNQPVEGATPRRPGSPASGAPSDR